MNNVAKTSIPSSAHLQSSPGIVQVLETSFDDDDDKWTSLDESVSSVVGGSSSPFKPHSFKSITKSSFKVSSQLLSGHPSNDWPCCEPSSYLPPLN
jgi:hypothetical protein